VTGAERKCWAPSQIGGQHWAIEVECEAIRAKRGMPSVERGAIRDRGEREAPTTEMFVAGAEREVLNMETSMFGTGR